MPSTSKMNKGRLEWCTHMQDRLVGPRKEDVLSKCEFAARTDFERDEQQKVRYAGRTSKFLRQAKKAVLRRACERVTEN